MKLKKIFRSFTIFEWCLWGISALAVLLSFLFSAERSPLSLTASLVGVTALIFLAKGRVLGQVLTVVFAVLYGIVSYFARYYGEMITYLGMTAPMAALAIVSWLRHPSKTGEEVEIGKMTGGKTAVLFLSTVAVTVAFYFILKALDTASLAVSTLSVATSWLAATLTFFRSPLYALAYALNDVVLVVLWVIASFATPSSIPVAVCFAAFLFNDLYAYVNWTRMKKRQADKT